MDDSRPRQEGDDEDVEREIAELRAALVGEEPLPPGMLSRLQAGVRRSARERQGVSWGIRLVVASVAFATVAAIAVEDFDGIFALAAGTLVLVYSWITGLRAAEHDPDM